MHNISQIYLLRGQPFSCFLFSDDNKIIFLVYELLIAETYCGFTQKVYIPCGEFPKIYYYNLYIRCNMCVSEKHVSISSCKMFQILHVKASSQTFAFCEGKNIFHYLAPDSTSICMHTLLYISFPPIYRDCQKQI